MNRLLAPLTALLLGLAPAALAQSGALPDAQPKVVASLVPEREAVAPGGAVAVALHEAIRKDWHTYWVNPGDSGAPTEIHWHLPAGWTAGDIQWPYPKRLPVGPLMNFGYEDEVALLTEVKAPADAKPGDETMLSADVMWLVCSDVCIPEETHLTMPLSVAATPPPPDDKAKTLFASARAKLPHASPWSAVYDAGDKRFALLVQSPELVAARPREIAFYPYADGFVEAAAPQLVGTSDKGLVIQSATGWKMATKDKRAKVDGMAGLLVLTGADGRIDALNVEAKPGLVPAASVTLASTGGDTGLLQALLFAFLGGLILNLMPCVFPVLSMKAAGARRKTRSARKGQGRRALLWRGRARKFPRACGGADCFPHRRRRSRLGLPIAAAAVRDRARASDVRDRAQSFRPL